MIKTFHFLSGLHRSGNTIVSALLNQHPEIYVSPLSNLSSVLWGIESEINYSENALRSDQNKDRCRRVQASIASTMYSDVEKPIVIDREKDWGHPANIDLAINYVNDRPKIIITVRDIIDVLGSYIDINMERQLLEANNHNVYSLQYKDPVEAVAEYAMRPDGKIQRTMFCIANAIRDTRVDVHIVEYEHLLDNPQHVMSSIYEFLNVENFYNNFQNISKLEKDNDLINGNNPNLHEIRKSLSRSNKNYKEILPDIIVKRYSGMEFWRK